MKKVFIFGLSVALVAGSVTSCKKTSKGKLSNDWTVTSWNSTETTKNTSGTVETVSSVSTDGSTLAITTTLTPSGGSTSTSNATGVINELTYTISKDGTFSSVQDVTINSTYPGGSASSTDATEVSGTWNFLGSSKTEEFKKNERVVFHTLKEDNVNTYVNTVTGQPSSTSTSNTSNTWVTGENSMIYVVVESKGKLLTLKSEASSTWVSGASNSSASSSLEFTLEQK